MIFDTFDLWDIWSEWWRNMTWPAKRQQQKQIQWRWQTHLENTLIEWFLKTFRNCNSSEKFWVSPLIHCYESDQIDKSSLFRPNYTIFAKFQKFSQISTFQKKAFFLRLLNIHWLTSVQMSRAEAHLGVSPAAPSQDEPALTLEQVKKKTKKNFGTAEKKLKKTLEEGKKTKKIWNRWKN